MCESCPVILTRVVGGSVLKHKVIFDNEKDRYPGIGETLPKQCIRVAPRIL